MADDKPQRVVVEDANQRAQREMAEAAREAAERNITTGPEGGRYIIGADAMGKGGSMVDAEGRPVKDGKD